MRRVPLVIALCVSLTVTASSLLLQWRSRSIEDRVYLRVTAGYDYRAVVSSRGRVHLEWLTHAPPLEPVGGMRWESTTLADLQRLPFYTLGRRDGLLARLGVSHWSFDSPASATDPGTDVSAAAATGSMRYDVWYVPHWLIAALPVLLPVVAAVRQQRQRKRCRLGLCPACGYDLRATPDRCPECGRLQR